MPMLLASKIYGEQTDTLEMDLHINVWQKANVNSGNSSLSIYENTNLYAGNYMYVNASKY